MVFAIHWHESAMDLHVFPFQIPPPAFLPIPSLWVFPVHQAQALVSCIQPGLAICFTLDNTHVSMLFSQIIPPSPSPTESKFCSVHLCLFFCFATSGEFLIARPSFFSRKSTNCCKSSEAVSDESLKFCVKGHMKVTKFRSLRRLPSRESWSISEKMLRGSSRNERFSVQGSNGCPWIWRLLNAEAP